MRFTPTVTTLDGYSMVNSVNSTPFRLEGYDEVGIQAVFTGSPTGTFKVQISVQQGSDEVGTGVNNWTDVANSSQAVTASGNIFWDLRTGAKWVRVVYTFTSGTGNLTVQMFAKGAN